MRFSFIQRSAYLVVALSMVLGFSVHLGAQGPDVIVGDLPATNSYGTNTVAGEAIYAYSVATTSCNIGNANLSWIDNNNQHPVIAQDMFRLHDGRFTQIGSSWLKHGFCALQNSGLCSGCNGGGGCLSFLTPGCADPYSAGLNGQQGNLGPRSQVNAWTGFFPYPYSAPPVASGEGNIGRRMQVKESDLLSSNFPGALYFVSGQYVAADDAQFGNQANNASYRRVNVSQTGSHNLSFVGSTQMEQPGIQAWQDNQSTVTLVDVQIPNEGLFIAGYDVTDNGDGTYNYEYAVYNMYSDRSANSFMVPFPGGATILSHGFHDVTWHSGEPHDGTDWQVSENPGVGITWSTDSFAQNPDANALRWSTMYNFYFTCNAPPEPNTATLGLFKPVAGEPDSVSISVLAPSGDFLPGVSNLTCTQAGEQVDLGWTNGEVYDAIEITRDGSTVASIAGSSTSWTDTSPTPGAHTYAVNGTQAGVPSGPVTCSVTVTAALDIAVPGGDPTIFDPFGGETFDVTITPVAGSSVQAGTESLMLDVGAGVETISLNFLGGVNYEMTFPPIACGSEFVWWIEAQSASGQFVSYPESGPAPGLSAFGVNTDDTDFEQTAGWTVGSPNDATTGTWERGDPLGTNAQPDDDHTAAGTQCWFTGQGTAGGSTGQNDVDNGSTTLYSAVMDMSGASNPQISYFRWYSNDQGGSENADIFEIEISDDASTWVNVETIGPAGAGTSGGWIEHSFLVSDFVLLSSSVQVRFIASDLDGGSIIEAAIDDFSVEDVDCSVPDCNTNGIPDADDIANGTSLDCDVDGVPDDCSTSDGTVPDCNANGIPDICDVAAGAADCDQDAVPDSCEPDTDDDGTIDDCDDDLDGDGIPNNCDVDQTAGADCDGNGQDDFCDLLAGATDCDLNGQLDVCQIIDDPSSDCDMSGTLDLCDITGGTADDCNGNFVPDSCDIANGTSTDNNGDGEPDECFIQDWVRGDVNTDGQHDISDAVASLEYLFGNGGVACEASVDSNNDDLLNIADTIFILSYLFAGGLEPEEPFAACGHEAAGSPLDCASFPPCP
ncbi:MAG: hypothetical protein VX404_07625 [Planctomycetota bacterium]|nr:hypothetical protein [Planctomycetota bacterium]